MASRPTQSEADLVPAAEPAKARYDRDLYGWSMEQAGFLREGRWNAIDQENLAEEIDSLGREQFNKLESALRVLLLHMLKWDHQPALRSRSWALSIKAQRVELEHILADNPGLMPRLGEAIARGYRRATIEAARETGLEEGEFPDACPYGWDDIILRTFLL